ncbi:glycoside hydrolase family 3 protein [Selenomonas ruminantium]|uniref:Beta-N-acetylhexosaminidase n=1 Tax=Selenomonas ruminantium TaxID=971 RepID=A0A1H0ULJ2_SELRU|nr:glycoside hydrolase family 3 protein [Selenomonas ruminantium]SDP66726.1 beta-N-acetylhexosaminidase [Selenomonas ruminantium]
MKKNIRWSSLLLSVMLLAVLLLAGCKNSDQAGRDEQDRSGEEKQLTLDEQVDALVAAMSTTEKVGQLLMFGVQGAEITDDAKYVLHQFHYGGVILFDRNLQSADQTKKLVDDLQKNADEKLPLFVAIDEEGGKVVRGSSFITPPPSQEDIGRKGEPALARAQAVEIAAKLKDIGVNVNFAPVADVGSGNGRSYSDDPQETGKFVKAALEGYKEGNVICALKHFPGIGRGKVDSHTEISDIEASEKELRSVDLLPFRDVIDSIDKGRNFDYMVMVGHLKYPAFDANHPASMSPKIITGLLREELGYQGLVITDDLEMGAIANHQDFRQAGAAAIMAGADIVLVCHEYEHAEQAYMGIYDAVKAGTISEARLDESVRRVIKAKLLHGLQPQK